MKRFACALTTNPGYLYSAAPARVAPHLVSVSPVFGPLAGEQTLVLTGTGFTDADAPLFGTYPAEFYSVDSSTQITARCPAHVAGAVDVTVNTPGGSSTLASGYTYTAAVAPAAPLSVAPSSGSTAGSTHVVVEVVDSTGLLSAAIDGVDLTSFAIDDSTHVSGDTVSDSAGAKDVTIANVVGASAPLVGGYAYVLPPFDLLTLDTSFRVMAGSSLSGFPNPANGGSGVVLWQGTPSAGISGTIDAASVSYNAGMVNGAKLLDGKLTLNFSAAVGGTKQLQLAIGDAGARAGGTGADTPIADHIAAGIMTATDGSSWALVWLNTISGNSGDSFDQNVLGAGLNGSILVGGASNDQAEAEQGFNHLISTPVATGAWTLLQRRQSGGVLEVRVNQGAWATRSCSSASGHAMFIGINSGGSADMFLGDAGASPTRYSDATFDDIYDGLKAVYPGASLP